MAEETISEIKYMSVESSQTEKKKEKKKENDQGLSREGGRGDE